MKKTTCRHCGTCGQPRPFSKQRINHILHALLTILTGGLWVFIWMMLGFFNLFKSYRCEFCGRAA